VLKERDYCRTRGTSGRGVVTVVLIVAAVAAVTGVVVWQAPLHSGPATATLAYLRAADAEQVEEAKARLSSDTLTAMEQAEQAIAEHFKMSPGSYTTATLVPLPLGSKSGQHAYRVTSVKRQGDRATVKVRVKSPGEKKSPAYTWTIRCVRESGQWKLDQGDAMRQAMVMVTGQALPAPLPEGTSAGTASQLTALIAQGRELKNAKRYEEAAAKYRQALALDPHCDGAHFGLGFVLSFQGHKQEAIAEFEKALKTARDPVEIREAKAALERLRK